MAHLLSNHRVTNIDEIGLYHAPHSDVRKLNSEELGADLTIAGGGITGVCAAVAAAREGVSVILIQDRPVLGGNASSEVRLWMLGATSHMGNNNRWSRESGVIGEILIENMYRNPEGNPLILDALLLEIVVAEPNITLLLNTSVIEVKKSSINMIDSIGAVCSQNSTFYHIKSRVYMDCTGDGALSFLSGASFRMGAESEAEFGEKMAPKADFGYLLGHSLYFYSKDTGKPVKFHKPAFADKDIEAIYKYRKFSLKEQGCNFWWVEFGGRSDTVHDTEQIKWELWKIVYGIWDYIKNSGKFPESKNHTLDWVGTIPGKRESRRFEGLKMITQHDVVSQHRHQDAVAYGGWALDLHPADGVFSKLSACQQYHSRGIYPIPLGATISCDISNLAFGGRIISASHVAFGSTRVMATCGYIGQATAIAAAYALRNELSLQDLVKEDQIQSVQQCIQRAGQHIPATPFNDSLDLALKAQIETSSVYKLLGFKPNGYGQSLEVSCAMLLPAKAGSLPRLNIGVEANKDTDLQIQLRQAIRPDCFTPEKIIEDQKLSIKRGKQKIELKFTSEFNHAGYVFICFMKNKDLTLETSEERITGVLSLFNGENKAVSNNGRQISSSDIGIESFEFWCPQRRPKGQNLALSFESPLYEFSITELQTGFDRPCNRPNAWIAALDDPAPQIILRWDQNQTIKRVVVYLDSDYDHPMESVLMGHPETVAPFCVQNLSIFDSADTCLGEVIDNRHDRVVFEFDKPISENYIRLKLENTDARVPVSVFSIRCYS